MTAPHILVNGVAGDTLSALDRGLQYGDGLFETMAVRAGRVALWERHLQRLALGCTRLGLRMPEGALLAAEAKRLCAGSERAVLKLIVTRGVGGRGYRPPASAQTTRIMSLHPWPDYPSRHWSEGVRVRLCATRLGHNRALAGIKHLNRLEQVLARAEWDDAAIAEGLMLDETGALIEATQCNLFLVRAGRLITPDLSECGVAGIMRGMILERAAAMNLHCDIRRVAPDELAEADEVFLCNSVIGLWPVRRIEERSYPPGPVTQRLTQTLDMPHV